MFNSKCILLCLCYLMFGSNGGAVPTFNKCKSSDKGCLKTSTQSAWNVIVNGVEPWGIQSFNPFKLHDLTINEGGLKVTVHNADIFGIDKCVVQDVERPAGKLKLVIMCPIQIRGSCKASGSTSLFELEGDGPFEMKSKIVMSVFGDISTVDGEDKEQHWKISNVDYTHEIVDTPVFEFGPSFFADEKKAGPFKKLMEQNSKEIIEPLSKPFISTMLNEVVEVVNKIFKHVPAKDMEIL